jgi:hypothetical protein
MDHVFHEIHGWFDFVFIDGDRELPSNYLNKK